MHFTYYNRAQLEQPVIRLSAGDAEEMTARLQALADVGAAATLFYFSETMSVSTDGISLPAVYTINPSGAPAGPASSDPLPCREPRRDGALRPAQPAAGIHEDGVHRIPGGQVVRGEDPFPCGQPMPRPVAHVQRYSIVDDPATAWTPGKPTDEPA